MWDKVLLWKFISFLLFIFCFVSFYFLFFQTKENKHINAQFPLLRKFRLKCITGVSN